MRIERDVEVPMRDGVLLRADVWRVDDEQPRPCVLWRTPYDRKRVSGDYFTPFTAVEHDYCAVTQDVRGRFGSDGDWQVLQWEQEKRDGYDTVEWIAAQPWCDGNVVMSGASYLGQVQWLTAAAAPPHLRAIAPIVSGPNGELERTDTGGANRVLGLVAWLSMVGMDWVTQEVNAGRLGPEHAARMMEVVRDPMGLVEHLPLRDMPAFDIPGFPIDLDTLFANGVDTLGTADASEIDVASLTITGWYEVLAGQTIENFVRLRAVGGAANRAAHRLIVGPWTHSGPAAPVGEVPLGLAAHGHYASQLANRHQTFFDRHTRVADADLPVVEYYVIHDGWRTADEWPPPAAERVEWRLDSEGKANTRAGDGRLVSPDAPLSPAATDHYDYDPADPVRTIGGRMLANFGLILAGPFDQAANEIRPDVLCYTSDPFEAAYDLVGPIGVDLFASSSAPDTDFVATLTVVTADGTSLLVASGIRRARYRNGFATAEMLEPGKVEHFPISLGHTGWRILPGRRLRLSVTSSNFPRFDRNTNTGNPPGSDAVGVVAHQQVHHSPAHASRLWATGMPVTAMPLR
jgi:putative CocE/NonD family hydrolase